MAEKLELVPEASVAEALAWARAQTPDITEISDELLAACLIEDTIEFGHHQPEMVKPWQDEADRRGLTFDQLNEMYKAGAN